MSLIGSPVHPYFHRLGLDLIMNSEHNCSKVPDLAYVTIKTSSGRSWRLFKSSTRFWLMNGGKINPCTMLWIYGTSSRVVSSNWTQGLSIFMSTWRKRATTNFRVQCLGQSLSSLPFAYDHIHCVVPRSWRLSVKIYRNTAPLLWPHPLIMKDSYSPTIKLDCLTGMQLIMHCVSE